MSSGAGAGVVVYRARAGIDAIHEYSRRLVEALCAVGTQARYAPAGLRSALADEPLPPWVLLQYNAFAYGRFGFAPDLLGDAWNLRRRHRAPLVVMVHEAWMPMADLRTAIMGGWQRVQLRGLLRLADRVLTSTEALAREVGSGARHVPVAATITPVNSTRDAARDRLGLNGKVTVALFGRGHESRALDYAETAIAALAQARGPESLAVFNLGAGAPPIRVPRGVYVSAPGPLAEAQLSLRLRASDLALLPFTDGLSTRRTTLMAALSHGLPVLGLEGPNTDRILTEARGAVALSPAGEHEAFARAAVGLAEDPARLRALGEAGERFYAERFDWPHVARQVAAVLACPR